VTAQPRLDPTIPGPLDRDTALTLLDAADDALAAGDAARAAAFATRVSGHPDPAITARALLALGDAYERMGHDDAAMETWKRAAGLPSPEGAYLALRRIAATSVRAGDDAGALDAYRRAERLAPPAERAEVASRIGWLSKQVGDQRGAGRAFARSRGGDPLPVVTIGIIVVTSIVSVLALADDGRLFALLELDKAGLAGGDWWRLLSPTLVHGGLMHLALNMFALWIGGSFVERLYGPIPMLGAYVLTAAAGSAASLAFGGPAPSVGASGAVFGLFGILFAMQRVHDPMLDRRSRAVLGQIGGLIVINLVLGAVMTGGGIPIDIAAHVGGLVAGLWLGFLFPPGRVATVASMWQRPAGATGAQRPAGATRAVLTTRVLGVLGLAVAIVALVLVGPVVPGA
jgi:membrane associated rhomboid family serine protease